MAVFVFAGSSQLAAVPLIAAAAPAWVILATAFCVNLRFIVFSAHLRAYVMHQRFWRRMLSGYVMADLNYVLFVQRYPLPADRAERVAAQDAYWLGNCLTGWTSWVVASLVGIALANSIPLSWGLGFAGILALLGILCSLSRRGCAPWPPASPGLPPSPPTRCRSTQHLLRDRGGGGRRADDGPTGRRPAAARAGHGQAPKDHP